MQCLSLLVLLSSFAISVLINNADAFYIPPPIPPPPPGYGYGYGYGPGPVPPPPPGYGYGYGYGWPCKKREAGFQDQSKEVEAVVMPELQV